MQNKNPQGNFDPNPDSDQELEKYGVWVKAEPQDLVEEPETEHQPIAIDDADSSGYMEEPSSDIEELEELPDFDLTLNESEGETADDLAFLDNEEPSLSNRGVEEPESVDVTDFGLDETAEDEEAGQVFDDIDLDMDLDEALAADSSTEDDSGLDFELPEDAQSQPSFDSSDFDQLDTDSGFEDTDSALSGLEPSESEELLPEIEMENIELDDETQAPAFDDLAALEEDLASTSPASNSVSSDLLQKIALELSSIKEELVSLRSQLSELKREPPEGGIEDGEAEEDNIKGGFFDDEDDDTIALTGDELDNILNTADFTVEPPEDLSIPDNLDEVDAAIETGETTEATADWLDESPDLLPEDGSYLPSDTVLDETDSEATEAGIQAIEGDEALDLEFEKEEVGTPPDFAPEINVITESPEDTSYLDEDSSELADSFEMEASPLEEVPLVEPDLTELDLGLEIDDALSADAKEDLPFMESAEQEAPVLEEEQASQSDQDLTGDLPELGELATDAGDDDFDSILELDDSDDEIILSIDGEESPESTTSSDFEESVDEIEEMEPLSMDPFEDETIAELELHKEGPRQSDGSWSSEPESSLESLEVEEINELPEYEAESEQEEPDIGSFDDVEGGALGNTGLLGSQEVEDLGGEEIEDLGGEPIDVLEEIEDLPEFEDIDSPAPAFEPEGAEPEVLVPEPEPIPAGTPVEEPVPQAATETEEGVPDKLRQDVKSVLLYLDQLLASLPEEKIEEFASSEHYDTYKKLFEDLGLL